MTKHSAENRKMRFNKVRPGSTFFFFFSTAARSQLCSAVCFQGEMAGGWHRTTLPSVPISASHGDVATDVCEVERCSVLTFCNLLHFFPMRRPLLCPQIRSYENSQKFIFRLKISYVWNVLIIIIKKKKNIKVVRFIHDKEHKKKLKSNYFKALLRT